MLELRNIYVEDFRNPPKVQLTQASPKYQVQDPKMWTLIRNTRVERESRNSIELGIRLVLLKKCV